MLAKLPQDKPVQIQILKVAAISALLFVLILMLLGLSFKSSTYLVLSLMFQILSGATLWLLASKSRSIHIVEVLGVGLALGSVIATLCAQALLPLKIGALGFQLPGLVTLIIWAIPSTRKLLITVLSALQPRGSSNTLLAYGSLLSTLTLLPFFRRNPEVKNGTIQYPLDIPYFEALSQSVTVWGNSDSIVAAGRPLRYHWFAYAWSGWETQISQAEPFVVLTRVLPLVSTLGIILLTIALVQMLSHRTLLAAIALTIGIFGTAIAGLGNYGSEIIPISPSQFMTTVWLMAASVVFLRFIKAETDWIFSLVSFAFLCIGCTGGKIMTSPILGGAIFAVSTMLIIREVNRARALIALITYLMTTISVYLLIVSDLNGLFITKMGDGAHLGPGMGALVDLSPRQILNYSSEIPWVLVGIAGIISLTAKASGIVLAIRSSRKLSPEVLFASGALLTGVIFSTFIYQSGSSHLYFILSGLILATPVATVALFESYEGETNRNQGVKVVLLLLGVFGACFYYFIRFEFFGFNLASFFRVPRLTFWVWAPIVTFFLVLLVSSSIAIAVCRKDPKMQLTHTIAFFCVILMTSLSVSTGVVWGLGEQLRPLIGRAVDKPIGYSSSYGWTPEHVVALSWLKRKTTVSDVFATNRFCRINEYPPLCDSGSLVVSALTGKRVLIEGYSWHSTGDSQKPTWLLERIEASLEFAENPTHSAWRYLRRHGVTWFVIDREFPKAKTWEPYGVIAFENSHIMLIHLVSNLETGKLA